MKISSNAIPDGDKLSAEISAEIEHLQKEGKIPARDEKLERAFAAFAGGKEGRDLLALARASAGILDAERLARKAGPAGPLVRAGIRFLARIFRDQEIFNSLVLEMLEEQERRIGVVEKRSAAPHKNGAGLG